MITMTSSQPCAVPVLPDSQSPFLPWSDRWNNVAQSYHWSLVFLAIGAFSTAIFPHPPLIALTTVAGITLPSGKVVRAAIALWFGSQILGYSLRGYPPTALSLAWALVIGVAILLMVAVASYCPAFSRQSRWGQGLWRAIAFGCSFLLLHGLVMLFWGLLGGHGYTAAVFGQLFGQEMCWMIALMMCQRLFNVPQVIQSDLPPVSL